MTEEIKNQEQKELTPQEKRKAEKERKKMENYANGMISRNEAFQMSRSVAIEEVGHLANFVREPLRASMIQAMAVVEFLLDKGVIESADEFQVYLDRVTERISNLQQEGDNNGEKEESGSESKNGEETQE